MQTEVILEEIKKMLEILADDEEINTSIYLKILAVTNYLTNGGASVSSIESPLGIACIAIGVNDLMERKAGDVTFSPAFNTIANQITRG